MKVDERDEGSLWNFLSYFLNFLCKVIAQVESESEMVLKIWRERRRIENVFEDTEDWMDQGKYIEWWLKNQRHAEENGQAFSMRSVCMCAFLQVGGIAPVFKWD